MKNFWRFLVPFVGLALVIFSEHVIAMIVGVSLCVIGLFLIISIPMKDRNQKAIDSVLADYEEIIGGQLWIGKDSEVIAVNKPRESDISCVELVCRTKNGSWFLFEVYVAHGRVVDRSLHPCDEATVKERLARHREIYVRYFGEPAVA